MSYISKQTHNLILSVIKPDIYDRVAIMGDNQVMCVKCLKENMKQILFATHSAESGDHYSKEWEIAGELTNWEDQNMYCSNCNVQIQTIY